MNTTVLDGQEQDAEIEAIKQVVVTLEHSQRHELPEEFIGLFRADAVWTTGHGKRLTGRDEIAAFTRQVLPGAMTDATVTYEVVDVLFIRSDVAAVRAHAQYWTSDGRPDGNPGSPLYVMAKDEGRWRLTACQNTEILSA
ncbi:MULTISPECIES: SgcJ/EcaC family oxidoreductase [unclassified Streptomyces]|uniref:SgcJ/EcaC family oxidoreductase n=1 Tax=unclassified Streptomyces TaxID=2593676 RepID=UPI002DD97E12|nr:MULTISPECIES: SgcJ/EcaC family oxidoreductase [unclassified Streptomyces]WSA95154.1 SgcJ/EcaC family oxidoreductase [Streptomyces sp. NBC_01795]WSB79575.1 SgcJ/EcaC family oxidoreductase [Streptomyces sp. NBC_01775]WSS12224.1 SgcJ/EcaC family oxidoreductase [Streptomyces sp. NBC_01186]WSS40935.1 SgcJ/EcaC family oxidoreductase [Streptomyces sp. NBC_01187]